MVVKRVRPWGTRREKRGQKGGNKDAKRGKKGVSTEQSLTLFLKKWQEEVIWRDFMVPKLIPDIPSFILVPESSLLACVDKLRLNLASESCENEYFLKILKICLKRAVKTPKGCRKVIMALTCSHHGWIKMKWKSKCFWPGSGRSRPTCVGIACLIMGVKVTIPTCSHPGYYKLT